MTVDEHDTLMDERETLRQECDRAWKEVDAMAHDRDNAEKERDDAIRIAQDNAEEVEKLEAELAAAQCAMRDKDTIIALRDAELASAQKDSDRYRCLKSTVPSVLLKEAYFEARGKHGMFAVMEACKIGDVDAAIDAALAKQRLRMRPESVAAGYGRTVEAQAADEIERLRKIEHAARLACGVLWMIDGRGAKVTKAFYTLRNAIEGPNGDGLKHAIKAAIDAGYEADHPPSADWWAGKKGKA